MHAFFNPNDETYKASADFNDWLKATIASGDNAVEKLKDWEAAPGARISHPREEHLLPLFIVAAAAGPNTIAKVTYNTQAGNGEHAMSSYLFQ